MAAFETGVVPPEVRATLSGLEFLEGMAAGRRPQPPIAATLGFRLVSVEPGRARFEGLPGYQHYNPFGSVHGGFAATLLDSCMACAILSTLERGQSFTTLEFKVTFVRPMTDTTGPVRAEGQVLHAGRRTGMSEGRLVDAAGKLLAHATTTCMIFAAG